MHAYMQVLGEREKAATNALSDAAERRAVLMARFAERSQLVEKGGSTIAPPRIFQKGKARDSALAGDDDLERFDDEGDAPATAEAITEIMTEVIPSAHIPAPAATPAPDREDVLSVAEAVAGSWAASLVERQSAMAAAHATGSVVIGLTGGANLGLTPAPADGGGPPAWPTLTQPQFPSTEPESGTKVHQKLPAAEPPRIDKAPPPHLWPPALQMWVQKCFGHCRTSLERTAMQRQVKVAVEAAAEAGDLNTKNWAAEPLPTRDSRHDRKRDRLYTETHSFLETDEKDKNRDKERERERDRDRDRDRDRGRDRDEYRDRDRRRRDDDHRERRDRRRD